MFINESNITIKNNIIELDNLIGCNIIKNKLVIYYFKLGKSCKNFITRNIKEITLKDKFENLISFKEKIIQKLNSNFKILFIINPYSGRKKGVTIFNKYKKYFIARGIKVSYFKTEYKHDCINFIRNIDKNDLIYYNTICGIGGDGIIHEIINGFGSRPDFDLNNDFLNFVKIGSLPTGSGNALVESMFKKSNLDYSIENAIYILFKNKTVFHSIQKYEILNDKPDNNNFSKNQIFKDKKFIQECDSDINVIQTSKTINLSNNRKEEIKKENYYHETIYGFLLFNYGYFSDVNLNPEYLRFMGGMRFFIYGFLRVFNMKIYKPTFLFDSKKSENKEISINEFYNGNYNIEDYDNLNDKIYSVLFTNLPYLMTNYNCSPKMDFNLNKMEVQIGVKKMGIINFILYALLHSSANHLKKDYKVSVINTNTFYLKDDSKLIRLNIDGEPYYGIAAKCNTIISKMQLSGL